MREQLLPQKAATAIHARMHSLRQNERTVEDFGKELSELFVELTISQAEGNSDTYKILRPLNEKIAIKRFADGLRNRRVSTIITARNFDSLKDAIQAAQEEEPASASGSAEVMGIPRPHYNFNRSNRGHAGRYRGSFNVPRGQPRNNRIPQVTTFNRNNQNRGRPTNTNQRAFRGNFTRGKFHNNFRQFPNSRNVHHISAARGAAEDNEPRPTENDATALNHFFRA